jgi:CBS domain-containing protein
MDVDVDVKQLLVADLMTIDPIVVAVDASIEDAARLLHTNSITGLPVVDSFGALVGVISQTDIVGVLDSRVGRVIRNHPSGLRVGELMSSPALTVSMTGSVEEAARLMVGSRVHRLVATDDAGHPVGVLSAIDLVRIFVGA